MLRSKKVLQIEVLGAASGSGEGAGYSVVLTAGSVTGVDGLDVGVGYGDKKQVNKLLLVTL